MAARDLAMVRATAQKAGVRHRLSRTGQFDQLGLCFWKLSLCAAATRVRYRTRPLAVLFTIGRQSLAELALSELSAAVRMVFARPAFLGLQFPGRLIDPSSDSGFRARFVQ